MLTALVAFIVVLGLLVFVHEAGHFLAARRSGMDVEEFGFGFPPRAIGVQRRDGRWHIVRGKAPSAGGGTVYSLNWLPLGGFVRIKGESGGDADDPKSFAGQRRWRRALVLAAGVGMNLVLAVVLFSAVFAIGARQIVDDLPASANVRDVETTIVGLVAGSPAEAAGLLAGDAVIRMDGEAVADADAVSAYIQAHIGTPIAVTVARAGATEIIAVTPGPLPNREQSGMGVELVTTGIVSYPIVRAVWKGIATTAFVVVEIGRALGALVAGLVAHQRVAVDIAGPVGIAVLTGQVAQLGFTHLLQFTAVLSANLAFLNVIPFPALDGGRLLFLAIEAIRRRALSARIENAIHAVGFAVLISLVLLVTYRDLMTFGGGFMDSVRSTVGL